MNFLTKYFHTLFQVTQEELTLKSRTMRSLVALHASLAGGCKIKYIKELAELYIVMNRQTYFDIIGHFLLAGSYTFKTLYSIVSLQFTHKKGQIRGHISLANASLRHVTNTKTEIHTSGGVTVCFGRSTTIYMPKLHKRTATDSSAFEAVIIHDDAELEIEQVRDNETANEDGDGAAGGPIIPPYSAT